jgi:tetratricopeptide (TPR) repeat protein
MRSGAVLPASLDAAVKGTLSEGLLPELLRELYVGRGTGVLHFNRGEERCGVRFVHGHIESGITNVPEMRMSEILVRLGKVEAGMAERAAQTALAEHKRLGQVLAELEVLSRDELEDAVALHLREVLLHVFSWDTGTYTFEEQFGEKASDGDITLKVSTGELILEAARMVQDPAVVARALGDLKRVLTPSPDPLLRFQKVDLTPSDGYVLSRIDGVLTGEQVMALIPLPSEEAQKTLFALLCTGLVEFADQTPRVVAVRRPRTSAPEPAAPPPGPRPPTVVVAAQAPAPPRADSPPTAGARPAAPPPAPPKAPSPATPQKPDVSARRQEILDAFEGLRAKNHFEVLGIPRASNEAQVKEAYFALARRFHPDVHHDPALADMRDKLEAVFIRLGEAYEILRSARTRGKYEAELASRAPRTFPQGPTAVSGPSTPGAPPRMASGPAHDEPVRDPEQEQEMARESLRQAERHVEAEQFWDAIQILERTIPVLEGRDRMRARVTLARAYRRNPNWVKQAEQALRLVLEEDPRHVDALTLLAGIYREQGMRARATGLYRKVLEARPDHEEALAALAVLAPQVVPDRSSDGRGFFKKLFGRE